MFLKGRGRKIDKRREKVTQRKMTAFFCSYWNISNEAIRFELLTENGAFSSLQKSEFAHILKPGITFSHDGCLPFLTLKLLSLSFFSPL